MFGAVQRGQNFGFATETGETIGVDTYRGR